MYYSHRVVPFQDTFLFEVLVDGKEWGEVFRYDSNFRFGPSKAKMILVGKDIIDEFYESDGKRPSLRKEIRVNDKQYGLLEYCMRFDNFQFYERIVMRPYLELFGRWDRIGFGREKAFALLIMQDDIQAFVDRYACYRT